MYRRIIFFVIIDLLIACKTTPPVVKNIPDSSVRPEGISAKTIYRNAYPIHADLIHTRLNISLDWKNKNLLGQAAIILKPHFYPVDSLILNARGMILNEVSILSNGKHLPLQYKYDSLLIHIRLDRSYNKDESFTIFIDYISSPDKLPAGGSSAITGDKGLYFINADSLDPYTPTQVWSQGETESNSVWFPTIENPAQKMTQEIYFTVDTAFTTLSNGILVSSINNYNGTKTDYWKQSLPQAPYLTMIAAGKYSVVKETWKNIEVSYYVDPPYERFAKMIFGNTPEILSFFSEKFGVPYYWEKYAQIVVHDYVSGAMENTTAVVHGTNMQQDPREYKDGNFEDYISHEAMHHWFGDLVTCESWSNLTLNEGFADYAEYLWREHKLGKENADNHYRTELAQYLSLVKEYDPALIRYDYANREDMYDVISYNKGGLVLNMLRNYTGDEAFFSSLQYYLQSHLFSSAEVADLRIAFEKITGEDLNWFFNQWFLQGGHPDIAIDYEWNDSLHLQTVTIDQKQNLNSNPLYRLPLAIDLYYNGKVERQNIIIENAKQVFKFNLPVKPDLINVDADKQLLCSKTDNKTNTEFLFQYDHAPLFLDRYESIAKLINNYKVYTAEANVLKKALHDKNPAIRELVLSNIGEIAQNDSGNIKQLLVDIAKNDSFPDVREKALTALGQYFSYSEFSNLFADALNDYSYKVVARAFKIIGDKDPDKAKTIALKLENDSSNAVLSRLAEYYSTTTTDKNFFYQKALRQSQSTSRYRIVRNYTAYLKNQENAKIITAGIDNLYFYAKKRGTKRSRTTVINSFKEIESSVKKKINDNESAISNSTDSFKNAELQSQLPELTSLKINIEEKIKQLETAVISTEASH
jgi:aminopeptidase N